MKGIDMKALRARVNSCIGTNEIEVLRTLLKNLPKEKLQKLMLKWRVVDSVLRVHHNDLLIFFFDEYDFASMYSEKFWLDKISDPDSFETIINYVQPSDPLQILQEAIRIDHTEFLNNSDFVNEETFDDIILQCFDQHSKNSLELCIQKFPDNLITLDIHRYRWLEGAKLCLNNLDLNFLIHAIFCVGFLDSFIEGQKKCDAFDYDDLEIKESFARSVGKKFRGMLMGSKQRTEIRYPMRVIGSSDGWQFLLTLLDFLFSSAQLELFNKICKKNFNVGHFSHLFVNLSAQETWQG